MRIRSLVAFVAVGALVGGAPASAQLSHPTLTNSSNPNELVPGTAGTPSRERESVVNIVSSAAGAFVTRYVSVVTVDGDGAGSSAGIEPLTSDYTIDFTVAAPGAYVLTVSTVLSGDMNTGNDGGTATADLGGISGSFTGGTLDTGSLDIADPGIISGGSGGNNPVNDGSAATIFGVSNGSTVPHSLRFVFTQSVSTGSGGGDEAAIRLGGSSDIATETAGDYPGNPARTQANDGHFVTVTLASLCGNGVVDSGPSYTEDCDEGATNGQPNSCCKANCTFVATGSPCDDGDACTSGESCSSGVCGGGTTQTCPLCQTCDAGSGCVNGPRAGCKLPTVRLKAKLQIKDSTTSTSDLVSYKWLKGAATSTNDFGDPPNSDDYALCVYAPGLALKMLAPAGGTCGITPCWKTLGIKGFAYKDAVRDPNGVERVLLKAGLASKAKTQLKGRGANLPPLPLPLGLPATVQLQSENGQCWEATFSSAGTIINDMTQYKGKSD